MKELIKYLVTLKEKVVARSSGLTISNQLLSTDKYILPNGEVMCIFFADIIDVKDIVSIQKKSYGGKAPWNESIVINEMENKLNTYFILCKVNNRRIAFIGFSYRYNRMHITNIATIPSYQNLGIGSFLIQEIEHIGQNLQCKYITLEVRVSNRKARSLYRTLGFDEGSIKKNYYHDNGEDALNMFYKIERVDNIDNGKRN